MEVVGKVSFVVMLAFVFLFGFASTSGYPGPFVVSAFSIAGLPFWRRVERGRPVLALFISAIACAFPFWLLAQYTADGDFTVGSLIRQYVLLALFAYGAAWVGLVLGRVVWAE